MASFIYEDNVPEMMRNKDFQISVLTIIVTVAAFSAFIYIIALYKKERIVPMLKFTLCIGSGAIFLPSRMMTTWSEAHNSILGQVGQNMTPIKTNIGIKVGLWEVDIYMEYPRLFQPNEMIKEQFLLGNSETLHKQHISALNKGWVWPLVFLSSLLGGEKLSWDGKLGQCLYKASCGADPLFFVSAYLWTLWCVSYKIAPCRSPYMMTIFGFSLVGCAATYSYIIMGTCPSIILPDGKRISMNLGWSSHLIGALGAFICILGMCIIIFTKQTTYVQKQIKCLPSNILNNSQTQIKGSSNYSSPSRELVNKEKTKIQFFKIAQIEDIVPCEELDFKLISPTARSQMFVL